MSTSVSGFKTVNVSCKTKAVLDYVKNQLMLKDEDKKLMAIGDVVDASIREFAGRHRIELPASLCLGAPEPKAKKKDEKELELAKLREEAEKLTAEQKEAAAAIPGDEICEAPIDENVDENSLANV